MNHRHGRRHQRRSRRRSGWLGRQSGGSLWRGGLRAHRPGRGDTFIVCEGFMLTAVLRWRWHRGGRRRFRQAGSRGRLGRRSLRLLRQVQPFSNTAGFEIFDKAGLAFGRGSWPGRRGSARGGRAGRAVEPAGQFLQEALPGRGRGLGGRGRGVGLVRHRAGPGGRNREFSARGFYCAHPPGLFSSHRYGRGRARPRKSDIPIPCAWRGVIRFFPD